MTLIAFSKALRADSTAVAMTEFALGAPFLMLVGVYGFEQANFVLVTMKVNQLATHLADNASRIGETSQLKNRKIFESDVNDVIAGAQIQGGPSVSLYDHGRVFISSLEVDGNGKQFIHWQRCRGIQKINSSYGKQGDTVAGMGPKNEQVTAEPGDAVIFVEVRYTYRPLVAGAIISNRQIRAIAAFNVRDSRDLTQIYQRDSSRPDPVQDCATYRGEVKFNSAGAIS